MNKPFMIDPNEQCEIIYGDEWKEVPGDAKKVIRAFVFVLYNGIDALEELTLEQRECLLGP